MNNDPVARRRPRAHDGRANAELVVFAATEELLAETTLQDLTVAQIIKRAGISRANFYHYFASKYDVVVAMVSRFLEETYAAGPWHAELGRSRSRAMDANLRNTIEMWSAHAPVICAVIEHMHTEPALAAAWNLPLSQFESAIGEQIEHERRVDAAPDGFPADTIATILVCALERTFYIASRGLDDRLSTPDAAVESIIEIVIAAIYGTQRPKSRLRRRPKSERSVVPISIPDSDENHTATAKSGRTGENDTATTILDAIKDLLNESSLEDLSVAKILTASGVSRATFYFYFGSKEEAFTALFRELADEMAAGFTALTSIDRTDTESLARLVEDWLTLERSTIGVIRNAIHEWPRRPELRALYVETVTKMTDALEAVIETDRASGLALEGPPAGELAAVLVWTIERSFAGALAEQKHLEDARTVAAVLGALLVATVYGR